MICGELYRKLQSTSIWKGLSRLDYPVNSIALGRSVQSCPVGSDLLMSAVPGAPSAIPAKKIVAAPEAYDGSPQKFHEWWSKVKVWIATTHATTSDQQKAAAVYSHLEGPHAGCFAQVHLDECMAANAWPITFSSQPLLSSFLYTSQ